MVQSIDSAPVELNWSVSSGVQFVHSLLRFLQAVRYRKNLVIAVFAAAVLLGGLYYATAARRYSSKAALLVTQTGHDRLDTSITNDEMQRQNTMPTFENLIRSAKVVEGALKNLAPGDQVDLVGLPQDTPGRPPAIEPVCQDGPLHEHFGGELRVEGSAGGDERRPGGRSVVPGFHGQHAQGDGRRTEPDVDEGTG